MVVTTTSNMPSGPVPLRSLLTTSEHLSGLLTQLQRNAVLTTKVKALLPADLAAHLLLALLQDGQLVLVAPSPVWASRLRFILPRLRGVLTEVQNIRVKVLPEMRARSASQSKVRRVPKLSPQVAEQIRTVADTLSDPPLRAALLRLAAHGGGQ